MSAALLAVRLDQAGFSARAIGLSTAVEGIAALAAAPCVPWVACRLGVVRSLMGALVAAGACLIGFTLTDDYAIWMLLRLGLGASATALFVLGEFWITSRAPRGRTGLAIAAYLTSLTIGSASGPLVLAFAGSSGPLAFQVAAALFLAGLLPLAAGAGEAPVLVGSSGGSMLRVFRRAPAAMVAGLVHGAIEAAALSLLPIYAVHSGAGVAKGASLVSLFVLGTSAPQIPIGWLADRVDRGRLLVVVAVGGAAGATLLASIGLGRSTIFPLLLVAWSSTVGAFYPVGLNLLGDDADQPDGARVFAARVNAAYVMTYALGMIVGPPLVGAGFDLHPPSGLFWTMAVLIGAYAAVFGVRRLARPVRRRRWPSFS